MPPHNLLSFLFCFLSQWDTISNLPLCNISFREARLLENIYYPTKTFVYSLQPLRILMKVTFTSGEIIHLRTSGEIIHLRTVPLHMVSVLMHLDSSDVGLLLIHVSCSFRAFKFLLLVCLGLCMDTRWKARFVLYFSAFLASYCMCVPFRWNWRDPSRQMDFSISVVYISRQHCSWM